jgi:phage-related protein
VTEAKKPAHFIASARDDLLAMPDEVRRVFGFAVYVAQLGGKHPDAKRLKGFGGAGILEVVEDYDGNTFRAVYTVKFAGIVYVLDAFQKKSKQGNRTAKHDIERIRSRLRLAETDYAQRRSRS